MGCCISPRSKQNPDTKTGEEQKVLTNNDEQKDVSRTDSQNETSEIMFDVKTLRGNTYNFSKNINDKINVKELKKEIENITNVDPSNQRLIFNGKEWENDDALLFNDLNVINGSTIHLIEKLSNKNNNKPAGKTLMSINDKLSMIVFLRSMRFFNIHVKYS